MKGRQVPVVVVFRLHGADGGILVDVVGRVGGRRAGLGRRRPVADVVVGVAVGGAVQDGVRDLAAGVVGEGVAAAGDGAAARVVGVGEGEVR